MKRVHLKVRDWIVGNYLKVSKIAVIIKQRLISNNELFEKGINTLMRASLIVFLAICILSSMPGFAKSIDGVSVSAGLNVSYTKYDPSIQPGAGWFGDIYDITSSKGKFPADAKLTLSFNEAGVTKYGMDNLRIFKLRPGSVDGSWIELPSEIDKVKKVVTANLHEPGTYVLGAVVVKDNKAPEVSWVSPDENATISGTVDLKVNANDNIGVSHVDFYLDNRLIGSDDSMLDGWGGKFDFSKFISGIYTLKAEAFDIASNSRQASLNIRIQTNVAPPKITINQPTIDPKTKAIIVTGTIGEYLGPLLWIDDNPTTKAEIKESNWTYCLEDGEFPPGYHDITAVAVDRYGNEGSAKISHICFPLTKISIDIYPNPPKLAKTPITIEATATGGKVVQYKYFSFNGKDWSVLRDYSDSASYIWRPASAGKYIIKVCAREVGETEEIACEMPYRIAPPLSRVDLSASSKQAIALWTETRLTAIPIGGADLEYKFEIFDGKSWETEDFNWCNQTIWTPTKVGKYKIRATVREKDTTSPMFVSEKDFNIKILPLAGITIDADYYSPQLIDTPITLKADAILGGNREYKFMVNDGKRWSVLQDYGKSNECTWTPLKAGKYVLKVCVREKGLKQEFASIKDFVITLPLSKVSLFISPKSPGSVGSKILLTAKPEGGDEMEYGFEVLDGGEWKLLRDYKEDSHCYWEPARPGTYMLRVTAREECFVEEFQSQERYIIE